jgi:hypothetical protein
MKGNALLKFSIVERKDTIARAFALPLKVCFTHWDNDGEGVFDILNQAQWLKHIPAGLISFKR